MKKCFLLIPILLSLSVLAGPVHALPIHTLPISAKRGGLSIALNTSGWQFSVSDDPTFAAQTFSAEVTLRNDSATDAQFTFPDAGSAAAKFAFTVLDATGVEVWKADDPAVSAAVITEQTLAAHRSWSRASTIPLMVSGAALPAGLYTLRATLEANPSIAASTVFQVMAAPAIETGLRGQIVLPGGAAFTAGTQVSITVRSAPLASPSTLRSVGSGVEDGFQWTGSADASGAFIVSAPAGDYVITAVGIQRPVPGPGGGPVPYFIMLLGSGQARATVTEGALTPVTITLQSAFARPILPLRPTPQAR